MLLTNTLTMTASIRRFQPRCTIEILNTAGQIVPILDEGASVEPFSAKSSRYREYWTEEEDLKFTHERTVVGPDGKPAKERFVGDIHGNFGFELVVRRRSLSAALRVDYFIVRPAIRDGALELDYEPKSVTVYGSMKPGPGLQVEIELQEGFSEDDGRPLFKSLRTTCRP